MTQASIFMRLAEEVSSRISDASQGKTQVFVRRARGVPQGVSSCVVVRVPRSSASTGVSSGAPSIWGSHVQVDCVVRACTGVDEVADRLMGFVVESLKPEATKGTSLAGLDLSHIDWDDDYDGESSVCISISYQLRHAGPRGGGVRV